MVQNKSARKRCERHETNTLACRWSHDLHDLLRPMFPGQLPRVGRNLFNAVALLDPGSVAGCRWAGAACLSAVPPRILCPRSTPSSQGHLSEASSLVTSVCCNHAHDITPIPALAHPTLC